MSEATSMPHIAIVGGGIGGLAAALFLRRAGIAATVYEQADALREVGAGLVVPPNMVRPLLRLGLGDSLQRVAVRLDAAWEFRRWQDGRVLFTQPMGDVCRQLYGVDCYVAHRADLLQLLQAALPAEQLRLGHRCTEAIAHGDGVQLRLARRAAADVVVHADAAIGADGIHSIVRAGAAPHVDARFSGLCAFRCLVDATHAPAMALRPVQTLWLGPGRHFVHYPISAGRLVNVVAIVPAGDWQRESWTAPGSVADLRAAFDGWDERVLQLIDSASQTMRWALVDREPLARWTEGRISLLGDAAHPMLPFFAQGAAQAIEDAEALASCLHGVEREALPAALQRYEALRRPRASRVQTMSRGREVRNHLPDGPQQQQRDAELARGDPLRDSAWLYGDARERTLPASAGDGDGGAAASP
ncbi:MAG TPA: FAD-dependent monooxygenase [Burkholderiaceae bacterium]|nr:FAD-dependent monooxygenase [Burkholderiaceae bacterium]